jgi:hypothetical protein
MKGSKIVIGIFIAVCLVVLGVGAVMYFKNKSKDQKNGSNKK